jgi:predicted  nucleic acid-binding Zn-ribbon protein
MGGFIMENTGKENQIQKGENAALNLKVKVARNEGVTRGAIISGIAGFVFLLILGALFYSLYQKDHKKNIALMLEQRESFNKQVTARDSIINDWLVTFDQIESDLSMIRQKERLLTVQSSGYELNKKRKEQVLEDIRYINTMLDNNKKKIASLSDQLNKSGGTIKGLQTKIASLETTIKQFESDVAGLKESLVQKNFEITQLNSKMTDMETTIAQKDEKIVDQINTMNKAYFATGTLKELKEKGIVTKQKSFLGLGKKGTIASDLNDSLFARIDIRETLIIPVNSKDAKLISKHPSDSYAIVRDGDKKVDHIEIMDPDNFWKFSKYAVVELIK